MFIVCVCEGWEGEGGGGVGVCSITNGSSQCEFSIILFFSGLCPVALGTDGGGSIRIPAAVCGVVGIKGT